jgi:predicted O-linked N-acetylglucosamine transferase (SPINDLY family)
MGVPVVTLVGELALGRAGLSQLRNLGLPELTAMTEDQFISIAAALAGAIDRLRDLRATLRQRLMASPIADAPRFARNIEAVYRQIWRKWAEAQ